MLARSDRACQIPKWKRDLARAFTRPVDLLDAVGLDYTLLPAALAAADGFRLLVPRGYAALIERGNPRDPLLRQVLPLKEELGEHPGFLHDPVGDQAALSAPGLLQKYGGRALLMVTGACALHCRYCFRRHFPYDDYGAQNDRGAAALAQLAESPDVVEVILSGGDPLMLDDTGLINLITKLQAIRHLKRLRVHTRMPVVLPSRITPALCDVLTNCHLTPVIVVHVNHHQELGAEARAALERLRNAGITLLNQSVLLRGVNDSAPVLAELSAALFSSQVLPYYLHMLDRVAGAAHFEVSTTDSIALIAELRARLPGYLVPQLVREEPGCAYKTPLF